MKLNQIDRMAPAMLSASKHPAVLPGKRGKPALYLPIFVVSMLLCSLLTTSAKPAFGERNTEPQVIGSDTSNNNDISEKNKKGHPPVEAKQKGTDENHCVKQNITASKWFDRTHNFLSESLCRQAVRIDHFFGEYDDDGGDAKSFFRIRNGVTWEYGESTSVTFTPRIRARLHLPNANERFNLLFSDDLINQDSISSNEEPPHTDENDRANYETALRWLVAKSDTLDFDFDIGLRSSSGIRPFTQFRIKKFILIDNVSKLDLTESIFWFDWEGFGTRTQIEYERLLAPNRLLRWTSAFTFSEQSEGVDLLQRLTLFETINEKRGLSFGVGLTGYTSPAPTIEEYGLSIRYRKNFFRDWLFLELEPEALWPIESERALTTRMTIRIEVQLGDRY